MPEGKVDKSCLSDGSDSQGPLEMSQKALAPSQGRRSRWEISASPGSMATLNPIRKIVDSLCVEPNPDKKMIALSIGDPTILGNLKPAPETLEAIKVSLESLNFNGYAPCNGYNAAREAVASYSCFSHPPSGARVHVDPQDVLICSGCSHALDLCINSLAGPGDNLLVPRPGFSIYKTLADAAGIKIRHYNLQEDKQWEIDLKDLESKIDEKTAAIVLINPSNPCGSVYSAQHLRDLLKVASRNFVPIIADEIYEHLVFPGHQYFPLASLSEDVPILSCSGLTKRFLVPGWRMGWIIIHDKNNLLGASVKAGLVNLSQRIIGSNTLVQGALPAILQNTPPSFFSGVINLIHAQAKCAFDHLKRVKGLSPVMPQGAMYMMVGIDMDLFPRIKDDLEFVEKLVAEQSVFCLPGKCFNYPNYMRIVLTVPEDMLTEACRRIEEFCDSHVLMDNHINYKLNLLDCEDVNSIS